MGVADKYKRKEKSTFMLHTRIWGEKTIMLCTRKTEVLNIVSTISNSDGYLPYLIWRGKAFRKWICLFVESPFNVLNCEILAWVPDWCNSVQPPRNCIFLFVESPFNVLNCEILEWVPDWCNSLRAFHYDPQCLICWIGTTCGQGFGKREKLRLWE